MMTLLIKKKNACRRVKDVKREWINEGRRNKGLEYTIVAAQIKSVAAGGVQNK